MIKDERILKLKEIVDKHQISPVTIAHIVGISLPTYYRYIKGETVPHSRNTRDIIDKIIEEYNYKYKQ
jgi:predicted DNA-binding transcriptional regulator AlpA